jgi:MraZ protein
LNLKWGKVVKSGNMRMFSGEFEYRIDEKSRVLLPPKYRRELEDGLVLTQGPDPCVVIYPPAEWEKIANSLSSNGSLMPSKLRRLKRAVFATAFPTKMDGQGRITLPAALRKYAGIEADIVVVGVNNYLEMWNKARWESEKSISQQQTWQIIESMENR